MPSADLYTSRLIKVFLHLDRLSHNMHLLQQQVGKRPLWPCIKADAYGHGAEIVARHLVQLGYNTFGVADVGEAVALIEAGIDARFVVFSATLPEHSEALVACDCEAITRLLLLSRIGFRALSCKRRIRMKSFYGFAALHHVV